MEKFAASFVTATAGIFVYLSLKELIQRRIALIGAIVFAFATDTWTISSQGLWQHGLVELLLSMSIYIIVVEEKTRSYKHIMILGILSGLFVFNRPADIILLTPILYYVLNLRDRSIAYYLGSMVLSGGLFLFYNVHYFGNIFGGYTILMQGFRIDPKNLISFAGLLISPSRGIFIYSPVLIFSILGYMKSQKIKNNNLKKFFLFFGIAILPQTLIYSCFNVWWAGWSYGPRFLTGILPALIIFLGLYMNDAHINIRRRRRRRNMFIITIFSILLIWSIFAQIVGAFYYPNGNWDGNPNVDQNPEKLWDLNDTQIKRSFDAGIILPHNLLDRLPFIMPLIGSKESVALCTHDGQYLFVDYQRGSEVFANRKINDIKDAFYLIDLGDNNIALQAHNGHYICAEYGGGRELVANRNNIGLWETFRIEYLGNNSIALRAYNGRYVSAEREGTVVSNSTSIGLRETFTLTRVCKNFVCV
ncbi:MAG: glycosyltransferase family 39 protein [Eubacteriales bacterium]|nr:glycosyltransferase family 39 protein [Eubacteriales bacterium]